MTWKDVAVDEEFFLCRLPLSVISLGFHEICIGRYRFFKVRYRLVIDIGDVGSISPQFCSKSSLVHFDIDVRLTCLRHNPPSNVQMIERKGC